ncbi:MAG TPA: hypothetical protein PK593_08980 [Thermomicrobiales bacterium]|nr:hypothetical protein [Thermomicrobiales bacterium]
MLLTVMSWWAGAVERVAGISRVAGVGGREELAGRAGTTAGKLAGL